MNNFYSSKGIIYAETMVFVIPPMLLPLAQWITALCVVSMPFIKMALIWFGWQGTIGWMAWSTARFYSNNCAAPGINGFISSLFSMGSPICISAWFSHAAFAVAYITAFIAAVLLISLRLWNHVKQDKGIQQLQREIKKLQAKQKANPPSGEISSQEEEVQL